MQTLPLGNLATVHIEERLKSGSKYYGIVVTVFTACGATRAKILGNIGTAQDPHLIFEVYYSSSEGQGFVAAGWYNGVTKPVSVKVNGVARSASITASQPGGNFATCP